MARAARSLWVHFRNSKKEKDADLAPAECRFWVYDWPEKSEGHHLCDAFRMAEQISKLNFHHEVLAEIRQSTRPVIEGGRVMYEVDDFLVGKFKDADEAAVFGYEDWPYKHDANGSRIPLRVRDRTSAALTLKALAVVDERWNQPQEVNVTKKIQAVLTLGERKGPQQQASPMRQDLMQRLEQIKANPNRATAKPDLRVGPVDTGNGGRNALDPKEKVSNLMGDDAAQPLPHEPPKALPPPTPQVSYARPDHRLDRQDAPNKGEPPPGGFRVR